MASGAIEAPEQHHRLKIDLHCHTAARSSCSSLTPEALVALARAAGLDAICLTEHDKSWTAAEIQQIRERTGFVVLRGMEVTTELGHVLVFGLEAYEPDMYLAANLRRHVLAAGGLMVLAHPARAGQAAVDLALHGDLFDALEGMNGSDDQAQNESAMRLSARLRLPPTAGSDCHSPREAGTVATVLANPVAGESELIAELRRGRHTTLQLNRTAYRQAGEAKQLRWMRT
jgi:predicted metal-dependent phosphoesterase TrpH